MKRIGYSNYPTDQNRTRDIIDVDFREITNSKFNIAEKSLAVLSVLLFLTCVNIPLLSIVHDLGSLIFVAWLIAFVCASSEWSRD